MPKTVILGAARTPIGKLGGGLASVDAPELGAPAIRAALEVGVGGGMESMSRAPYLLPEARFGLCSASTRSG